MNRLSRPSELLLASKPPLIADTCSHFDKNGGVLFQAVHSVSCAK